jgi:hypothetical protein
MYRAQWQIEARLLAEGGNSQKSGDNDHHTGDTSPVEKALGKPSDKKRFGSVKPLMHT